MKYCLTTVVRLFFSNPITDLDRLRGFQEVEAPRFQNSQLMKVVRFSALRTGRLYLQVNADKTKCMVMSRDQNAGRSQYKD